MRPRNDFNCMTFYYGPATWFLTLSPSEWAWNDLDEYLHKVNPNMNDLSTSALVAADQFLHPDSSKIRGKLLLIL